MPKLVDLFHPYLEQFDKMILKTGIFCGMGTVILANITSSDLLKTSILAFIGAVVSTVVGLAIKRWWDHGRKPPSGV